MRGGSARGPTPYPFIYHFSRKRYPFRITSVDKWYPFYIGINPKIECFPYSIKSQNSGICSALWAISQTQMTDFLTFLNNSTSKIPTLSYTWSLKKVPLSGGASQYATLKRVPSPPPLLLPGDNLYSVSSAEEAQKLIDDSETRNTVKFSYYKASKGFGGKGEK